MSSFRAYTLPFFVFLLFLGLREWLGGLGRGEFFLDQPQYWVFPLQTLVCGALLWRGWRHYALAWPRQLGFTLAVGVAVLLIWIAPQCWLGAAPRLEGFDPTVFAAQPVLYAGTLFFRFLRLVVVVPLVEEIFWRGFLLRFLIREPFESVPMGSWNLRAFLLVCAGFMLEHSQPDWIPALLAGALYNFVAIRTRSLASCVVAHAVTNLLLGLYIMQTRQWGFW
jgi:hypothetical protein